MESIAKLGLSVLNTYDQVEDTRQLKKKKDVKLKFTIKEFEEYKKAVELFTEISSAPEFLNIARKSKNNQNIGFSDVQKQIIFPIIESVNKIDIEKQGGKKKVVSEQTKNNSFFIKRFKATSKSVKLFNSLNKKDIKTIYDQREFTCISDAKKVLHQYYLENELITEEYYLRDQFLLEILPNIEDIPVKSWKSEQANLAKSLIDWKPKE